MIGSPGILGPDGRVVSAERVALEKRVRFNPLRGWTPDVLVRQLEAFCRGEIAQLAWVMEWLEKHDDVISTVAPKAKAAVSRWGYDVIPKDEISPELKQMALDQQGVLQEFYQTLETSDAVELEESGGMRLFVQQIMDAYGKVYGAHHIIWMPSRSGLRAEMIKVPTWFFEVTTGRMMFLPEYSAQRGVDLETLGGRGAWMLSKGRGVMLAGVLARMFKQIPLQDWLTYCDRHGMPAFIGKTTAAKGSTGWNDMRDAVAGVGSEFGAVINQGDMIDVLNLTGQGEVPYVKLVERMDRAQIMLWRGGDLGTLSRESGTGSNPQQDDADELDADNAAWVSETINRNLTKKVVAWHFGPSVPVLVELKLRTRTRQDIAQDLSAVTAATDMNVRVSESWFCSKFGIVAADPEEKALSKAIVTKPGVPPAITTAINAAGKNFRAWVADATKPVASAVIDALEQAAQDPRMTDAEFMQRAQETIDALQSIDPQAASEMAAAMEAEMLSAVKTTLRKS